MFAQIFWIRWAIKLRIKKVKQTTIWKGGSSIQILEKITFWFVTGSNLSIVYMMLNNLWLIYMVEEVRFVLKKITSPFWEKHTQMGSCLEAFLKTNIIL